MRDKDKTKDQLLDELEKLRHQLSELKRERKSIYDSLTGLPTRTLLYDRLNQELLHASRKGYMVAVLFLCLNNLKLINDTFGLIEGDKLLKETAQRLKKCLRKSDTLARPGSDEFIVILPEITKQDDAMMKARKLLDILESPFLIYRQEILLNTSIGISLYPNDGLKSDNLLKNSYTAMRNAKKEGKSNYMFFSSEMNTKAFELMSMENSLRLAIKRKEFILYYQPQVELHTGRIVGMESLLRWKRPGFNLIHPLDFIPVAEDTELIVPIGEWSFYTACAQQRAWQKAGIAPERMAVNMTATHFRQKNIVEIILKVLKDTGLDPNNLEIELTESAIFQNEGEVIAKLVKMRDMGINISIDDFGTGYSSLSYLKQFPVNRLKIVSYFVRSISIDFVDSAIAKLIIDFSHILKLKVLAEGVETEEQVKVLRLLGCDEVQGYFFSKPLDAEQATKILIKKRIPGKLAKIKKSQAKDKKRK